jgi:pimeloyl-ACP methyl ester carboxylesterase
VVDAASVKRFPLLGASQGCAIALAYAARHPERVSHLNLYGGYALGAKKRSPRERELLNALTLLTREGWGTNNPAFRQIFTAQFMPGATKEQMDEFNELQRRTTSPRVRRPLPRRDGRCGRDRSTARATLGKGLAVSAFPLYVPV